MTIIRSHQLVKEFRRVKAKTGRLGTVRTLFSRDYSTKRAVDGISFEIEPGELVGYIGPNGAGKSTTIKMLSGILVPTSGELTVAGTVPWRDRERNARQIGILFGQRTGLWWDLPLRDSLTAMRTMYDIPKPRFHASLARLSELLSLDELMDIPVRQLSLGQRMRGDLAAAMIHEPRILYLDEPTIGLDVLARTRIRDFITELNRELGTTVILTTHDLGDVERLCSRVILIDHGNVLYDGDIAKLKALHAPYRELIVRTAEPAAVGAVPGVEIAGVDDGSVTVRFDPAQVAVADVVSKMLTACPVTDLSIVEPNLEGVVAAIYAGEPS